MREPSSGNIEAILLHLLKIFGDTHSFPVLPFPKDKGVRVWECEGRGFSVDMGVGGC